MLNAINCQTIFMPGIAFNLILIRVGEQRAQFGDDYVVDAQYTKKTLPFVIQFNPHPEANGRASESTDADQDG